MKKKIAIMVTLLVMAALVAVPAFAATDTAADAKAWFDQMFSAKKAAVDQAVQDGRITAEQGATWKAHFDQMYKFHEENGFSCPMGGPGMGKGMGRGQGAGMGMGMGMGRWGGQGAVSTAPAQ
jgi:membrane protein involved in colicin uptake